MSKLYTLINVNPVRGNPRLVSAQLCLGDGLPGDDSIDISGAKPEILNRLIALANLSIKMQDALEHV